MDLVDANSNAEGAEWLNLFHHQSAIGRELHQVAMEFYLVQGQSPSDRLGMATRVVNRLLTDRPSLSKTFPKVDKWLRGDERIEQETELYHRLGEAIAQAPKENPRLDRILPDYRDVLKKTGALVLNAANPLLVDTHAPPSTGGRGRKGGESVLRRKERLTQLLIERLQGEKLNELLMIITTANRHLHPSLKELVLYLKVWQRPKRPDGNGGVTDLDRKKSTRLLLLSLENDRFCHEAPFKGTSLREQIESWRDLPNHWDAGVCHLRCFEIGRLTLGSDSAARTPSWIVSPTDHWTGSSPFSTPGPYKGALEHYYSTLGRFDIVTLQHIRPMSRSRLPWFSELNTSGLIQDEKFLPFIGRREIALPFRISLAQNWPLDLENSTFAKIAGFLSVTLSQRSSRLIFIERLIYWQNWRLLDGTDESASSSPQAAMDKTLSQVVGLFERNDCILLCEGWGDIVIVFTGPLVLGVERLNNIFRIQNAFYQDFLVNRTELVLTPAWLEIAHELAQQYTITQHIRIVSAPGPFCANDNFVAGMAKVIGRMAGSAKIDTVLFKTPGRSDFTLDLTRLLTLANATFRAFCRALREEKEMDTSQIDDVMTIIAKKEV